MPLAYSYLRFSSPEQLKGDSVRRQLDHSRAYAEQHGLTLDETMRDLGVSAFKGKNRTEGALGRFTDLVKSGKVPRGSLLIVESLDRLSRETPRQALTPFLSLIESGIRVVTLADGQEYDQKRIDAEPWQLMASLMVMMRAHEESQLKSERVGAAWKRKHDLAHDRKVTARCPAWLRLTPDRKRFEIVEDKARAVRMAFELTAKGIGRQKVAALLNTKERTSGATKWYAASLARLLKSDAVLGTFQPHSVTGGKRTPRGPAITGYFPAIVKADVVARARAAMAEAADGTTGTPAGRKGKTYSNLFGNLAFCNACNAPMRMRSRGKRRGGHTLVCSSRFGSVGEAEAHRCQHKTQYQYAEFERDLLRFLKGIDLSIFDDDRSLAVKQLDEEIAGSEIALKATEAELQRWMDAFGADDVVAAKARIKDLDERQRKEVKALALLKGKAARDRATGATSREHIDSIMKLEKRMAQADGDERYLLRAQLAQELRRVISTIKFGHANADCVVSVRSTRDPKFESTFFLRRSGHGKKVTWESFRRLDGRK